MSDFKDLRWVRVFTPDLIPHYLIDQVKQKDFTTEDFYKFHQLNCLMQGENGVILNPFNHLYVLADKENLVKGVLWFSVDPLTKDILVQTFSMDKAYWNKGRAVHLLADHVKEMRRKAKLNKIYWITNYPRHSERYGFKPSKSVLMEYREEVSHGQDNHGQHKKNAQHRSTHTRTEAVPERSDRSDNEAGNGGSGGASAAVQSPQIRQGVSEELCGSVHESAQSTDHPGD